MSQTLQRVRYHLAKYAGTCTTDLRTNLRCMSMAGRRTWGISLSKHTLPRTRLHTLYGRTQPVQTTHGGTMQLTRLGCPITEVPLKRLSKVSRFYLNGQIDWSTSSQTRDTFTTENQYVPVPVMLDLNGDVHSAKNISTAKLRGGAPRVGGSMEYIPSVGGMGVLVALACQT
jgi:hypothetical protein